VKKERMTEKYPQALTLARVTRPIVVAALVSGAVLSTALLQAQQTAHPNYPSFSAPQPQLTLPPMPVTAPITPNGAVVEDVIARINDQIITRSEYEQAERFMMGEVQRQGGSEADFQEAQKNLFRDMIDQQILLAKGKELGITGEAEMTRRLDDIRKQNHLDSMEALEKAAASQGVSFEDFKQSLRNNAITQKVVQDEVGRHLQPTRAQEQAFYNAHAKEYTVPEQVHLSEILIPTPDPATDAQVAEAQKKADAAVAKLKAGTSFADVAKAMSGGPTASAGGDLGDFKRGALGDVLESATFSLPVGGFTEPIRTRQGFVVLKVDSHQAAGVPPLDSVENQVQEGVYMEALQPALRDYLTKQRTDMYVEPKAGFVDTGAIARSSKTKDVFTAYHAPAPKKKTVRHEKAEAAKAAQVQAELATARAKVAEKNAERAANAQAAAAKNPTAKNVAKASKPPKIHREKIRFGQSPRNSLPTAPTEAATITNGPLSGQAPGVAMALTASTTTITTGGVPDATTTEEDPLAIKAAAPTHKTRFSQREPQANQQRLDAKLTKVEVKANTRSVAATPDATASEKMQAAPLGLNGDTVAKKRKKVKGEPKGRIQEQPSKPVEQPAVVPAPTANPSLVTTPAAVSDDQKRKASAPSADQSTLPPSYVPPNSVPPGTPIPATTSADPNAPVNTPSPK
jgi:peptidyl-prolyl cis-trans isomerase SurA